jgi:hypothetical protein
MPMNINIRYMLIDTMYCHEWKTTNKFYGFQYSIFSISFERNTYKQYIKHGIKYYDDTST